MKKPQLEYNVASVGGSKKKVRGLKGIIEIANITKKEKAEWTQVTEVILPYARQLAKEGKDPSAWLVEAKERCPVDITRDIDKILEIYAKNYQPTFSF